MVSLGWLAVRSFQSVTDASTWAYPRTCSAKHFSTGCPCGCGVDATPVIGEQQNNIQLRPLSLTGMHLHR